MKIGSLDYINASISNNNDVENLRNKVGSRGKSGNDKVTSTSNLFGAQNPDKVKEADNVAKEFETLFVDMMMKSMRETVKNDDESNAQSIYKGMLDNEYSKNMTDAQSFGIRDMVREWILNNSTLSKTS